jgi:hypothetical protein
MKKIPISHSLIRGAIGKKLVFKQYQYGSVITKFPCMDNIVASPAQQYRRNIFKEAVAFARSVNNDPVTKQHWSKKYKTARVYNHAIRQYIHANK